MKIDAERRAYPVTADTIRDLLKEKDELLAKLAEFGNEIRLLKQQNADLERRIVEFQKGVWKL